MTLICLAIGSRRLYSSSAGNLKGSIFRKNEIPNHTAANTSKPVPIQLTKIFPYGKPVTKYNSK
jgi:hypothetical protein